MRLCAILSLVFFAAFAVAVLLPGAPRTSGVAILKGYLGLFGAYGFLVSMVCAVFTALFAYVWRRHEE